MKVDNILSRYYFIFVIYYLFCTVVPNSTILARYYFILIVDYTILRFRYDFRTRAYLMSTLNYVDLNGSFGTPVPGDLLCRVDEAQQYSLGFPTCI